MKSYFQYLTTPTSDTKGTTILVHFDRKRYLFGSAGEGLQRAAVQQGARVLKISEVFISGRTEWSNVGGLLGLILVLADGVSTAAAAVAEQVRAKVFGKSKEEDLTKEEYDRKQAEYLDRLNKEKQSLTIYGPGGLNYMLATARRFIFRTSMPISAHEIPAMSAEATEDGTGPATFLFKDDFIRVWGLHTPPTTDNKLPRNERKRSHEVMEDIQSESATTDTIDKPQSVLELTRKIVFEMFSSDWRIDRLFSCPLDEIKLPAKIFVRDPKTKKIENYNGPLPGQPGCNPKTTVLVRSPWPGAVLSERLPAPPPAKDTVSYIVRTYPQRGRFDPKKALELGLKDKSKWNVLTLGESLQNDKGETITPDMVLEPSKEATGFVVADLPSVEYVQPFLDQIKQVPSDIIGGVGAYCWILGEGVYQDRALQDFITGMTNLQHMMTAPDVCKDRFTYDSAASATIKLSALDPVRYRIPKISEKPGTPAHPAHVVSADRGQIFQLEPVSRLDNEQINPIVDIDSVLDNVLPEARDEADRAESEIQKDHAALIEWASKVVDKDAEVITTGTGSALPSKYRNVSGTLVRVPGWGSILLDAGENTVGQLRRIFSPEEFTSVMRDLRCIWISHLHADHHLGTASVIKSWYQTVHGSVPADSIDVSSASFNPVMHLNRSPQLTIMSDTAMLHWLFEYSQLEDFGFSHCVPIAVTPGAGDTDRATLLNWFVPPALPNTSPPLSPRTQRVRTRLAPFSLGFADVQACSVRHCNGAMAVSMTLPSGFKLSYSGDCRPSTRFSEIGRGTTLLVHEATFDDELRSDAVAKRHSTTGEALMVGAKMGAKAVVLTHFSQRYAKVPVLEYEEGSVNGEEEKVLDGDEDEDEEDIAAPAGADEEVAEEGNVGKATFKMHANKDMKVCVAFDYMRIKVGDIAKMEKYVPALLALYEGEERRRIEEKAKERDKIEKQIKEKEQARNKSKNKAASAQAQNGEKKADKRKRKSIGDLKAQNKQNGGTTPAKESEEVEVSEKTEVKIAEKSAADNVRDALKHRRRSSQMDTSPQ
ncbi:tRNase Z endonuclease-like protein [Elsinoe fawcettii]|nr:tRNase Z endonuclease-like protein [Elsinoe fawcettii]